MGAILSKILHWPFEKAAPVLKEEEEISAYSATTIRYKWDICDFGDKFPNPSTTDILGNKTLHSPSFVVPSNHKNLPHTEWHMKMDCKGLSPTVHPLVIFLEMKDAGFTNYPLSIINSFPEIDCRLNLVDDKEEVQYTNLVVHQTMAIMNLPRDCVLAVTRLENVWKKQSKFFPDNVLRIRVQLSVMYETTAASHDIRLPPPRMNQLGKDLLDLLHTGDLADVTFHCQSKTFRAHKLILSARCTFFHAMFNSNMKEAEVPHIVDIVDIEPEVFSALLHYLYSNELNFPPTDLQKLYALAAVGDKYGLLELKDHCFACLQVQINLNNAGNLAVLACFYNNVDPPTVGRNIRLFCHANWDALGQNPDFRKLVQDFPAAFVRDFY